jgi:hypothetical protein
MAKGHIFSLICERDLIEIQTTLWKTVHAKGRSHMREGR